MRSTAPPHILAAHSRQLISTSMPMMRLEDFERRERQLARVQWLAPIPTGCILAILFVVLAQRRWWLSLSPRMAVFAELIIFLLATVGGYWAYVWSFHALLKRHGLLCPQCRRSLMTMRASDTLRSTGQCPSCGLQLIGHESDVARTMPVSSEAAASLGTAERVRYSPIQQWRGFLVIVAWILSPMRWVVFDIPLKDFATARCGDAGWVCRAPIVTRMMWSLWAPGIIATALWLAWQWHRARTYKRLMTPGAAGQR